MQDITYNKHRGNPESNAAFEMASFAFSEDRRACYDLIAAGPRTAKECAKLLGKPFNAVSGRLTELKKMGLAEKAGGRRDGSAILKICSEYRS